MHGGVKNGTAMENLSATAAMPADGATLRLRNPLQGSDILTFTHRLAHYGETGGSPFCLQTYDHSKVNSDP